jgi:hypothetical protein
MNSCKQARPLAVAAFCAAILTASIFDSSNSKAAAAGLFGTPSQAELIAAPARGPSTMREALRGPNPVGVLRDRLVSLNLSELARVVPVGADFAGDRLNRARNLNGAVTLDLFPGLTLTAQRTDIETPEAGGFVWVGEDRGARHAFVTLVINNNEVLGHIQTGGKLYSIEPVSGPLHRIIEIDQSKILDDMHAPPIPEANEKKSEALQAPLDPTAALAATTINVMVAHTAAARVEVGTAPQMQARIDLAISLTNQAFKHSGVPTVFVRVGGANEIPATYNDFTIYGQGSFANYLGVLCDLSGFVSNVPTSPCFGKGNNKTATFNALRAKRTTVGADLVVLMRKQGAACGIAWVPSLSGNIVPGNNIFGFSVVTSTVGGVYSCIEGNTMAHETGHNQGLNHDRVQHKLDYGITAPNSQTNFGYVNKTQKFFTIMAYRTSCETAGPCTRIPYYSTPLKKYPNPTTGVPVGIAQGLPGAADAAKVLKANKATVAGYR